MCAMRRAMIGCVSGLSVRSRAWPLCPGLPPPGRDPSRLAFQSVDGGFDDVRDVLSGRCNPSTRSINSGFVSRSSSSRFMDSVNHRPRPLARGWVVTQMPISHLGKHNSPHLGSAPCLTCQRSSFEFAGGRVPSPEISQHERRQYQRNSNPNGDIRLRAICVWNQHHQ